MSAELVPQESTVPDSMQEYIIEMLFSLAKMATEAKQFTLAARIQNAADSTVVFL